MVSIHHPHPSNPFPPMLDPPFATHVWWVGDVSRSGDGWWVWCHGLSGPRYPSYPEMHGCHPSQYEKIAARKPCTAKQVCAPSATQAFEAFGIVVYSVYSLCVSPVVLPYGPFYSTFSQGAHVWKLHILAEVAMRDTDKSMFSSSQHISSAFLSNISWIFGNSGLAWKHIQDCGVYFFCMLLARKIVRDKTSWCNRLRKMKGIDICHFCHAMLAMLMKWNNFSWLHFLTTCDLQWRSRSIRMLTCHQQKWDIVFQSVGLRSPSLIRPFMWTPLRIADLESSKKDWPSQWQMRINGIFLISW